ncbi:hypothetical protein L249_1012 [Ophiocordyceps polyrhachis-furcata BCC 54312]|uniref:alpha-1,2-Mannosidase n=1 Tax=Ophiocordyceps polyrhachis-furcata BCC 54312 TaxID=1330021 RepID=A0A367LG29_9HYPO|nr:hypothetical protein L249_1012 [Ophiocordyceps polyrhachis-furcata BCC 54312]
MLNLRRLGALAVLAALAFILTLLLGRGGPRMTTAGSVRYVASSFDWSRVKPSHPVARVRRPPTGRPKAFPRVQAKKSSSGRDDVAKARRDAVKRAFVKSWEAYKAHAWGKDELMPLSGKGRQTFSGWAAQLVDALDTLWIMGLRDDFRLAVREVAVLDWSKTHDGKPLDVFEVTIRHLGGLLAAYDLSGEAVLLSKAVELGNMLYAAFDTPNRLPARWLDHARVRTGQQKADASTPTAAAGSLCLELTRLTQLTGDARYYDAGERVKQFFRRAQTDTKVPGLWPRVVDLRDETADGDVFTLGAGADSLYEYLPKMHALLGGLDPQYEDMATRALDAAHERLLFRPATPKEDDRVLMAGRLAWDDGRATLTPEMQHLTCFAGGTYALAGRLLSRNDYVALGSRLAAGCVWAYDSFATNIMPEISELVACDRLEGPCRLGNDDDENNNKDDDDDDAAAASFITASSAARALKGHREKLPAGFVRVRDARYLLRPEAVESVFYLWRITGRQVWRDAAWRMWEGIVRETETELAFASVDDVRVRGSAKADSMETFWLSETTKYFYLIFEDEGVIDLDQWVLNTEAHPLKRPRPG